MTGKELKAEREKRGLSQPKIAQIIDVSTRQVANLESGETPIKPEYVALLKSFFEVLSK